MEPTPHLMIAGTGRSGTTFLVQYLTALGLDTYLSRHPDASIEDEAQAGFEQVPLVVPANQAAYVVKFPWLHLIIDEVLAEPTWQLDGVIIPVRRLEDAAQSRIRTERASIQRTAPWTERFASWDEWSTTPGGVSYSLDAGDQAKSLAVGLHRLVETLVRHEIPMAFVAFPRSVEDADYLYRSLTTMLPTTMTREAALAAHRATADPSLVRVGRPASSSSTPASTRPRTSSPSAG